MKQVADSCYILILQEHWLFNFEENDIFRYLPNHEDSITSVDSDDPISPYQRPRGYGGAAILWHSTLLPHISTLKEKTARITAISNTKVAIKDICIIGAYFPCRGLRESEAEFEDTLMQVAETCSRYIDTHFIIVAADFNADLSSSSSTVQITFIFIDFRVCDFAFAFKTQNAPCVSRFKRVLFSDRFQFVF